MVGLLMLDFMLDYPMYWLLVGLPNCSYSSPPSIFILFIIMYCWIYYLLVGCLMIISGYFGLFRISGRLSISCAYR